MALDLFGQIRTACSGRAEQMRRLGVLRDDLSAFPKLRDARINPVDGPAQQFEQRPDDQRHDQPDGERDPPRLLVGAEGEDGHSTSPSFRRYPTARGGTAPPSDWV